MPFIAKLKIPIGSGALDSLSECIALRDAILDATEWEGILRIDVLRLLLLRDVYGDAYGQEERDRGMWGAADIPLLTEGDVSSPEMAGLIGEWNIPFLRWLKSISLATKEEISVEYEHERGDTPYEYVWWTSRPSSSEGDSEVFGVSSHEGMEDAEWRREIVRYRGGRTEVEEMGDAGDLPRYL
jgi:hypothetical protein